MLSIEEALAAVIAHCSPLPPRELPLIDALGKTLAADAYSDVDSPPHDKAMVDGYAIVAADLAAGEATLTILEEVTAGDVPSQTVVAGSTTRIMTGAPIPKGADAVVMIEQATLVGENGVLLRDTPPRSGQNILPRATSFAKGQLGVAVGTRIRSIEIGVLGEMGHSRVHVHPTPRVAVVATGNELVPIETKPGSGQIRNSNSPMLVAAARECGVEVIDLGIIRDEETALSAAIDDGLTNADVLVLSGGVSAGVLDLVPKILSARGVRQVFHKVNLKPGKPLWFGVQDFPGRTRRLVFGLPGNPVGSLVCFHLFVRPAIERLSGQSLSRVPRQATLAESFNHRGERPTFYPARLESTPRGEIVYPLKWRGSADLATLVHAQALIAFPGGTQSYPAGAAVEITPI